MKILNFCIVSVEKLPISSLQEREPKLRSNCYAPSELACDRKENREHGIQLFERILS